MSTHEQIEANRRNGKLSKGPTTTEGKAKSAKNARKHGLLSADVLLPHEDQGRFSEFSERLTEELKPESELESVLVARIILMIWRLERLGRIEAGILTWQYQGILAERTRARAKEHVRSPLDQLLSDGGADQITDRAKHQAASDEERSAEERRRTETGTLGLAFVRDGQKENAFSKLSRYETSIERSLYKAMHELQRLQAARQGHYVPPPQVIEVEVARLPEHPFAERTLRIIEIDDLQA